MICELFQPQTGASPNVAVQTPETASGLESVPQAQNATWRIRRLHRGSGKARWRTITTGLSEYLAKTWARDSNAGSRNWKYVAELEL